MKTKLFRLAMIAVAVIMSANSLQAQVTIGSDIEPNRATLLDLKTRQATGTINNVDDNDNISSTTGGLLLPRVKLVDIYTLQPFIAATDGDWTNAARRKALSLSVAGLMVYNLTTSDAPGNMLYPAIYTWDGEKWATPQYSPEEPSRMAITRQPKPFTFYETGLENSTYTGLDIEVQGATGVIEYQWYQVLGNNVHVRMGKRIGEPGTVTGTGANTSYFYPTRTEILKGTTRNANHTGFYRFYCIVKDESGKELVSDVAEIAVGCGAKTVHGEWITFMCFNLGANVSSYGTISQQKNATFTSIANPITSSNAIHSYAGTVENNIWGFLYQWGRIGDGHERRNSSVSTTSESSITLENGAACGTSTAYPLKQVRRSTEAYGKFVPGSNWAITYTDLTAVNLWQERGFESNDPCMHFNDDGTFAEFWSNCSLPNTKWRIPTRDEWIAIYKGDSTPGSQGKATANTWEWWDNGDPSVNPLRTNQGYEIKPDGVTTTLFLPASGDRHREAGLLYRLGQIGFYWSSSAAPGNDAYHASLSKANIIPTEPAVRSYGNALRCVKME